VLTPAGLRRGVALLCMAATLAFAGLDAMHRHTAAERAGSDSRPCSICHVATSTLAPPVAVRFTRPVLHPVAALVLPQFGPSLAPVRHRYTIRPPPPLGCC